MIPHRNSDRTTPRRVATLRRGTAMIIAIVCLLLVTAISFSVVKYAVLAHQQSVRLGWGLQSAWLAESALPAAASQLRDDSAYAGGEWVIENIGPSQKSGRVSVTVSVDPERTQVLTLTVTADFPDHSIDRVRTTRSLSLSVPKINSASTN